jgi:ArsR family transcriptional regulator, arsenate/arsenite/antimonite-responsive transcriptional repressor
MATVTSPPRTSLALAAAACCSPVTGGVLGLDEAQRLAHVLKAIADPMRLRLLSLIGAHSDGEACVCDLTEPLGLTQPTVSHHLKVLVDAGILSREQRGRWAYYHLIPDVLPALAEVIGRPSR